MRIDKLRTEKLLHYKNRHYIRIAVFGLDEILPFVFTKAVRRELCLAGYSPQDRVWKRRSYIYKRIVINNETFATKILLTSSRLELFATKGVVCKHCGLKGTFFALERHVSHPKGRFHLNLYGYNNYHDQVMLTKDHIMPKSLGGKNNINNYQTLCYRCNGKKGNEIHAKDQC